MAALVGRRTALLAAPRIRPREWAGAGHLHALGRPLSSSSSSSARRGVLLQAAKDTPKAEAPKTYKELFMKYLYINGGVAVVVVGGYLFYKGSTWTSGFSLSTVFKIGFVSGGFAALALAGLGYAVVRIVGIRQEQVYRHVLHAIQTDGTIKDRLGGSVTPGPFIATNHTGGLLAALRDSRRGGLSKLLAPGPRRLAMLFEVSGPASTRAMVSVDAVKPHVFGSGVQYRSIAVDFPEGDRRLLAGAEADVVYRAGVRLS